MPPKKTPQVDAQVDSDSTAMTDTDTQESGSNTKPRVRKRQHDDELTIFMLDMKKMFLEFKAQQEENFKAFQNTLLSTIDDIKKHNSEIRSSIEFLANQYSDLTIKIEKIEKEKNDNLVIVGQLQDKIEILEKKSKLSCLEIRNIPTKKSENKLHLIEIVKKLTLTLNINLESNEIHDVYRTNGKPDTNKPIIIEFTSILTKEKFLQAFKSYNRDHHGCDRLSTKILQLDIPSQPIFISEALTFKTKTLFFRAREFAKANNYNFCWTAKGKVYLRKKEGAPFILIKSENNLTTLLGKEGT